MVVGIGLLILSIMIIVYLFSNDELGMNTATVASVVLLAVGGYLLLSDNYSEYESTVKSMTVDMSEDME